MLALNSSFLAGISLFFHVKVELEKPYKQDDIRHY